MLNRRQFLLVLMFFSAAHPVCAAAKSPPKKPPKYYLPGVDASRLVTVTKAGEVEREITILTETVATKESGPKETVARFGEVYALSPASVVVRRNQPTRITFWNLQPDDEHDFALAAPNLDILMYVRLPPLRNLRLHIPRGRSVRFLVPSTPARDERADHPAA
jgi:hypothetical protein